MAALVGEIMSGNATDAQIGAIMAALATKGETFSELAGAARAMRRKATRIQTNADVVVDTCGTGGDGSNTFNISTTAAFVVAGCGVTVAKHGNRSVSSKCGSADLLEALGVNLEARSGSSRRGGQADRHRISFRAALSRRHAAMRPGREKSSGCARFSICSGL